MAALARGPALQCQAAPKGTRSRRARAAEERDGSSLAGRVGPSRAHRAPQRGCEAALPAAQLHQRRSGSAGRALSSSRMSSFWGLEPSTSSRAPLGAALAEPPKSRTCVARARDTRREPYIEPTFVFDIPGDSNTRPATPAELGARGESSTELATSASELPSAAAGPAATSADDALPPIQIPDSLRRPAAPAPGAAEAAAARGDGTSTVGPTPGVWVDAVPSAASGRDGPLPALAGPPDRGTLPPQSVIDSLYAPPGHKSGYVALIGQPNAGKSTLLNALIGQKLSIVTRKPQTTRHRILGLCSARDYQIVLYDTPGVIPVVSHKLDDCMMHSVRSATINADCLVLVVDITLPLQPLEALLQSGGSALAAVRKKPCALVLNKVDKLKPGERQQKVELYQAEAERCLGRYRVPVQSGESEGAADKEGELLPPLVLPMSAKYGGGVRDLLNWMLSCIPYGPAYYPKDVVSELPERFFVAEILREQLLLQYRQEVPYACQVLVRNFKERQSGKDFIALDIVVERENQKGIILGKGGLALKQLATSARMAIEEFLGREAFLEIVVKVKENWREDEQLLKQFGLNAQSRGDWY